MEEGQGPEEAFFPLAGSASPSISWSFVIAVICLDVAQGCANAAVTCPRCSPITRTQKRFGASSSGLDLSQAPPAPVPEPAAKPRQQQPEEAKSQVRRLDVGSYTHPFRASSMFAQVCQPCLCMLHASFKASPSRMCTVVRRLIRKGRDPND